MSNNEKKPFSINDLVDIHTELGLLRALMEFDTEEVVMAMVKLKSSHFYDEDNRGLFEVFRDLESRNYEVKMETVRTELMKSAPKLLDALMRVVMVEPSPAVMFAVESLEEWQKKRELYRGFSVALQGLSEGHSSLQCANDAATVLDDVTISSVDDFTSYAFLKEKIKKESPVPKIKTGLSFLDVKLKGGIEFGQFIGVMGDPEAGKTVLVTQILKYVSSCGF